MQIVAGIAIILIGLSLVIKTEWFMQNFGRVAWFENNLGTDGGSRLGYKLLGVILLFIGIIMMTGSGGSFFGWVFSPLMKYSTPGL